MILMETDPQVELYYGHDIIRTTNDNTRARSITHQDSILVVRIQDQDQFWISHQKNQGSFSKNSIVFQ